MPLPQSGHHYSSVWHRSTTDEYLATHSEDSMRQQASAERESSRLLVVDDEDGGRRYVAPVLGERPARVGVAPAFRSPRPARSLLEQHLQRELHLPRRSRIARREARVRDDAERRAADCGDASGQTQIGLVEDVEGLDAELQPR